LPGDKSNECMSLTAVMAAKFGQTKDLSLNLGKQRVYRLNAKPPALAEGFLDVYFKYSGLRVTNVPTLFSLI
jgi:hypothetical protein